MEITVPLEPEERKDPLVDKVAEARRMLADSHQATRLSKGLDNFIGAIHAKLAQSEKTWILAD